MAVAMFMSIGMDAQSTAEDLRDKADSLYNIQQYDEAKTVALEGLDRLGRGEMLMLLRILSKRPKATC